MRSAADTRILISEYSISSFQASRIPEQMGSKQRRVLEHIYLRTAHAKQHRAQDAAPLQTRCHESEQGRACAHSARRHYPQSLSRSTISLLGA